MGILKYPCCIIFGRFLLFVIFILTFPCAFFVLNIYTWYKYKRDCCHYDFWNYHFGVRPKLLPEEQVAKDLETVVKRYMVDPPFKSYRELKNSIRNNPYINSMLVRANSSMPNLFFHVELAGSLCERFGKPLPSPSVLASDYDLMLVASRLTVFIQDENQAKTKQPLNAINDLAIKTNPQDPYYWMELSEGSHDYLKRICLSFYDEDNKQRLFLSSAMLKPLLEIELNKMKGEILRKENKKKHLDKEVGKLKVVVDITGPAVNVKLKNKLHKKEGREKKKLLLDVDFTLALPCFYWPEATKHWFGKNRSHVWITRHEKYKNLNDFKKRGLHFVPKQSLNFIEETMSHEFDEYIEGNQEPYEVQEISKHQTKYPSLEWRVSFSLPEIIISNLVPEVVRWAFMILKSIIKRHVIHYNDVEENKSFLKMNFPSYLLKSTLYWYMDDLTEEQCAFLDNVVLPLPDGENYEKEKFDAAFWRVFEDLVRKLEGFLSHGKVPHYWWFQEKEKDYYNLLDSLVTSKEDKWYRKNEQKSILQLLHEMVSDTLNEKASIKHMCNMEADLEFAKKSQMKQSMRYKMYEKLDNEKENKFDHIEAHKKYLYYQDRKHEDAQKLFRDANCLPFAECGVGFACCQFCQVDIDEIKSPLEHAY